MRLMPDEPLFFPRPRKKRRGRVFAPPVRSARLYVYIDPAKVGFFRFMLEAHDNLGLMTVVDRWRCALLLRFAPGREKEMREFLEAMREILGCGDAFLPGKGAA
ncbi:MAG: DUF4911 domain-containing protein [Desulfovibrio sp.]|jgi:hypothetical protein|nr:DUF4911 domain-containing protein [Desulfovibrio sp.]